METNFKFAQQGWQCPICKRVYSPFTPCCYYCGGESKTWTSVSTSPVDNPTTDTSCWEIDPVLRLSNPPKLVWKCKYCGKEMITEVTEMPSISCNCLRTNNSQET